MPRERCVKSTRLGGAAASKFCKNDLSYCMKSAGAPKASKESMRKCMIKFNDCRRKEKE